MDTSCIVLLRSERRHDAKHEDKAQTQTISSVATTNSNNDNRRSYEKMTRKATRNIRATQPPATEWIISWSGSWAFAILSY
jgi:hypothetical protein